MGKWCTTFFIKNGVVLVCLVDKYMYGVYKFNEILLPLWACDVTVTPAWWDNNSGRGCFQGPLNLVQDVSGCSPGKSTGYFIFFSHVLCTVSIYRISCPFFHDFLRHRRYFSFWTAEVSILICIRGFSGYFVTLAHCKLKDKWTSTIP